MAHRHEAWGSIPGTTKEQTNQKYINDPRHSPLSPQQKKSNSALPAGILSLILVPPGPQSTAKSIP